MVLPFIQSALIWDISNHINRYVRCLGKPQLNRVWTVADIKELFSAIEIIWNYELYSNNCVINQISENKNKK